MIYVGTKLACKFDDSDDDKRSESSKNTRNNYDTGAFVFTEITSDFDLHINM